MILARRRYRDYVAGINTGNSLLDLLASRRDLGVSDARDMIFAHLGMMSDSLSGKTELAVDYSKSCPELFTDVARYFLRNYQDYRILSHIEDVDLLKRRQDLPSWVPDWTSTKALDPDEDFELASIDNDPYFPLLRSAEGKQQLIFKGEISRQVEMIGSNVLSFAHLKLDEIRRSWSTYTEKRNYYNRFATLVKEAAEAAGLQNSPSFQEPFGDSHELCEQALESVLASSERGGPHSGRNMHPVALVLAVLCGLITVSISYVVADPACLRILEGKRLCLLKDLESVQRAAFDEIALVPRSTQAGDFICRLDGERRIFVLRQVKSDGLLGKRVANNHFMLVGRCYYRPSRRRELQLDEALSYGQLVTEVIVLQ